jgi:hypothetical protein
MTNLTLPLGQFRPLTFLHQSMPFLTPDSTSPLGITLT